jgi:hypothetical protein
MRRHLVVLTGLLAIPTLAQAQIPDMPRKTVAPVTVVPATDPPQIVSSFPAAGQAVAPGALVMKITFDQKMDPDDFAFAAAPGAQAPNCLKQPRLLADDKTFVLLCTTAAKTSYGMAFNAAPQGGFANIGGTPARPAQLAFSTNDDDGPHDIAAALKLAGLTANDLPIATQP